MATARKAKGKASAEKKGGAVKPVKKGGILMAVLAAFVVFTAAEIYIVTQKAIRQNKKPEFVMSFPNPYKKGLNSVGEYGNYLYGADCSNGFVYKTNKQDGQLAKLYQLPEFVYNAVEDSAGNVYILDKKNTVQVFTPDDKPMKNIKIEGLQSACWLEADSKDNFYVVDCSSSVITKYDSTFKKISSFGGQGEGKGKFTSIGKVFSAPNGDLYCINLLKLNEAQIVILDSNGRFKKAWKVTNMQKFSDLASLAITKDGYVYMNSFEGTAINIYDNNGNFMGSFDTDAKKKFLITYPPSITGGKNGLLYIPTHDLAVFKPIQY